jgi:hypothetical protein
MPRTTADPKLETLSFRIPVALKAAIAEIAERDEKPLGALLRELVSDRVEKERRRAFEAEARRQSLEIAAIAADPTSDEAVLQRGLDALFDEFAREWK